jgi:hypothetical protein
MCDCIVATGAHRESFRLFYSNVVQIEVMEKHQKLPGNVFC